MGNGDNTSTHPTYGPELLLCTCGKERLKLCLLGYCFHDGIIIFTSNLLRLYSKFALAAYRNEEGAAIDNARADFKYKATV